MMLTLMLMLMLMLTHSTAAHSSQRACHQTLHHTLRSDVCYRDIITPCLLVYTTVPACKLAGSNNNMSCANTTR